MPSFDRERGTWNTEPRTRNTNPEHEPATWNLEPGTTRFTDMFLENLGHRRLLSLLSRAIARNTLPQALLLAGPSGVGKRRVALALAQALNCLDPQTTGEFEREACGK